MIHLLRLFNRLAHRNSDAAGRFEAPLRSAPHLTGEEPAQFRTRCGHASTVQARSFDGEQIGIEPRTASRIPDKRLRPRAT